MPQTPGLPPVRARTVSPEMRRRRDGARGDPAALTLHLAAPGAGRTPPRPARSPSRGRSRTLPGPPPGCTAPRCTPSPGGPAWPPRRPGRRGAAWASGTAPPRAPAGSRLPGRGREDAAGGAGRERGHAVSAAGPGRTGLARTGPGLGAGPGAPLAPGVAGCRDGSPGPARAAAPRGTHCARTRRPAAAGGAQCPGWRRARAAWRAGTGTTAGTETGAGSRARAVRAPAGPWRGAGAAGRWLRSSRAGGSEGHIPAAAPRRSRGAGRGRRRGRGARAGPASGPRGAGGARGPPPPPGRAGFLREDQSPEGKRVVGTREGTRRRGPAPPPPSCRSLSPVGG